MPRLMHGDPITYLLGEDIFAYGHEVIEEFKEKYGLNKPLHEQFLIYLWSTLRGDLGYSFSFGAPISALIADHMPRTLMVTLPATILASIIGCFLGCWCGWRLWEKRKRGVSLFMLMLYSTPPYWSGMLLLLIFSLYLGIMPPAPPVDGGLISQIRFLFLPVITLLIYLVPLNTIIMRSLIIKSFEESYVSVALSKGLRTERFMIRHLIKPALPPFIAMLAIEFAFAFSGSLLVEIVYSWPGMGLLMWNAVIARDYPLLQSVFTLTALIIVVANAIADFILVSLDPRTRGV